MAHERANERALSATATSKRFNVVPFLARRGHGRVVQTRCRAGAARSQGWGEMSVTALTETRGKCTQSDQLLYNGCTRMVLAGGALASNVGGELSRRLSRIAQSRGRYRAELARLLNEVWDETALLAPGRATRIWPAGLESRPVSREAGRAGGRSRSPSRSPV